MWNWTIAFDATVEAFAARQGENGPADWAPKKKGGGPPLGPPPKTPPPPQVKRGEGGGGETWR